MAGGWNRRTAAGALTAGLTLVAAGCGEPTAQLVVADDAPISFELPADYAEVTPDGVTDRSVWGPPGSSAIDLGADPVWSITTLPVGNVASYQMLRMLATNNAFDPLDPKLDPLPDGTTVLAYEEINETDVWGVRLVMSIGRGARDYQALVHRATDEVVVTDVVCTVSCFRQKFDTFRQIQGSWSLES